ncbi:uncharacterized protein TM35_000431110 [Trypanosoma theileri]|uniref:Uncharacterized protein n=1 Tax=Trypanosoma theileri TaxID=67003 RepID=A0A1X0NJ98_9TRYP|nr:uncharacterized protein TM35_000431110 [Trypanosoma theileri]ORC84543.1 hypothetical protein TM35_000431110 [Trypanosoma theileri]
MASDSDDDEFAYVAPSKAQTNRVAGTQKPTKTVYEEERDARIRAIVQEHNLTTLTTSHQQQQEEEQQPHQHQQRCDVVVGEPTNDTRIGNYDMRDKNHRRTSTSYHMENNSVCVTSATSTNNNNSNSNSNSNNNSARSLAEEAQRLKDQRYAIYRRNRALNQNALKEVDPGTKRYMQVMYTPANNGVRQHQPGRRPPNSSSSSYSGNNTQGGGGRRQFTPHGSRPPKRPRE